MTAIEIYSTSLCPFAHRSLLTLREKGIPFRLIEIDLLNKPTNFDKISPYGKVPVLKNGENRVWESAIINEYLDEMFPTPALLPKDPMQRAHARIWINFADTRLFAVSAKLLHSQNPQQYPLLLKELTENLLFIENQALQKVSDSSPYWLGSEISLVDFAYYPWFEQLNVLEHFRGFKFPANLERLKQWCAAVASQDSVKLVSKTPELYIEKYYQLNQVIQLIKE